MNKFDLEVAPFFVYQRQQQQKTTFLTHSFLGSFGCNIEFEVDNLLTELKYLLTEFGWNLERLFSLRFLF